MAYPTWISWTLYVALIVMLQHNTATGTCSSDILIVGGGTASSTSTNDMVYGCKADCVPSTPQVHMIIRSPSNENATISIKNSCNHPVNVTLVLVSEENWTISIGNHTQLQMVQLVRKVCDEPPTVIGVAQATLTCHLRQSYTLVDASGGKDITSLLMALPTKFRSYHFSSINYGTAIKDWSLTVGGDCCSATITESTTDKMTTSKTSTTTTASTTSSTTGQPKPTSSPVPSSSVSSSMASSPGDLSSTLSSSSSSSSSGPTYSPTSHPTPAPSTEPSTQAPSGITTPDIAEIEGASEISKGPSNLAIVIGLVVLSVILLSLTIGVGCCFYRHKQKAASGRSQSTEPNVYVESPTRSVSERSGVTRDNGDVEYEEAATVTPPVIPPRDPIP